MVVYKLLFCQKNNIEIDEKIISSISNENLVKVIEYGMITTNNKIIIHKTIMKLLLVGIPVIVSVNLKYLVKNYKSSKVNEHVIILTGIQDKNYVYVNSWGEKWNNCGFATVSTDYVCQITPIYFITAVKLQNKLYSLSEYVKDIRDITLCQTI